jgi:hypothetical protein
MVRAAARPPPHSAAAPGWYSTWTAVPPHSAPSYTKSGRIASAKWCTSSARHTTVFRPGPRDAQASGARPARNAG